MTSTATEILPDGAAAATLAALRSDALTTFALQGIPNGRHESWRYTSLEPIRALNLTSSATLTPALINEARQRLEAIPALGPRLVLVNGFYAPELSDAIAPTAGIRVREIHAGATTQLPERFGQLAVSDERSFTALNLGRFDAGLWLSVSASDAPILEVVQLTLAHQTLVTAPRVFIELHAGAALTLVETHLHEASLQSLANSVTEIYVGERARLRHARRLHGHREVHALCHTAVELGRAATFDSHLLATDGALNRDELRVTLAGPDAVVSAFGLALGRRAAHLDLQSLFHHQVAHTTSVQLYKGIYADAASGVFNGKVVVAQEAQKTDARQTNRNLLLNATAIAYTRPQLEIYADDVKCSHGATVGQLDPAQLFYLRSRGLGLPEARAVLTRAFAGDVLSRLTTPGLEKRWHADVSQWLRDVTGGDA